MAMERRELLEHLQAELLQSLDDVPADKAPAVSRELREITRELELMAPAEVSSVDDLAQRRADRRAKASGQ